MLKPYRLLACLFVVAVTLVTLSSPASAGTYQTTTGALPGGGRTTGTWKDGPGSPTSFAGSYATNKVTTLGTPGTIIKVGVRINYRTTSGGYASTALVTLPAPKLGQMAVVQLWQTTRIFVSAEFWTYTVGGVLKKTCLANRTCSEVWT